MKGKLILVLALIMGLITTYYFYEYMKDYKIASADVEETVQVVIAKEKIEKNHLIQKEDLAYKQVPKRAMFDSFVTDIDSVVGKYANAEIAPNEPLLSHRFQAIGDESLIVAKKLQEGYRAVSIGVNFVQSVSNLIEPEDNVDVVVTIIKKLEGQIQPDIKTHIVKENVRVLAVGRRLIESTSKEDYVEYSSVTLELKPEDAVKVIQASQEGTIQLTLHSKLKNK